MRSGTSKLKYSLAGLAGLACLAAAVTPAHGDEPSRFGRLFRMGSASDSSKASATPALGSTANSASSSLGGSTASPATRSVSDYYGQPALSTPTSSSTSTSSSSLTPSPRISPKPRVNKPITEADPLVSRIAVGRADGGSQFGMFTQIYADGTVIDSEGVHKLTPEQLKPVVEAVTSGDFGKIKGHCGGPAGDTFENFQVVAYERAYGRLRANAFSYSGTPQGCDHAVHHLHKVLDDLQIKMSTPGGVGNAANTTPTVVSPAGPAMAPAAPPSYTATPVPIASSPSGGNLPMPGLPDPGLH